MKATHYMRKPFVASGFLVTEKNMDAIARWCEGIVIRNEGKPPFIRVPVDRPMFKKQTEARIGDTVMVSVPTSNGPRSYKVYAPHLIAKDFIEVEIEVEEEYIDSDDLGENPGGDISEDVVQPPANVRPLPTQMPKNRHVETTPTFRVG